MHRVVGRIIVTNKVPVASLRLPLILPLDHLSARRPASFEPRALRSDGENYFPPTARLLKCRNDWSYAAFRSCGISLATHGRKILSIKPRDISARFSLYIINRSHREHMHRRLANKFHKMSSFVKQFPEKLCIFFGYFSSNFQNNWRIFRFWNEFIYFVRAV